MANPELQLELQSDHGGDIDWIIADLTKNDIDRNEITQAVAKLTLPSTAMYRGSNFIITKYFDNYFSVDYGAGAERAA